MLVNLIIIMIFTNIVVIMLNVIVPISKVRFVTYHSNDLYKVNLSDEELNALPKLAIDDINSYGETINITSDELGDNYQILLYNTVSEEANSGFAMSANINQGISAADMPVGSYILQTTDGNFLSYDSDLNIDFNTITRDGTNNNIIVDTLDGLIHITKYEETKDNEETDIYIDPGHGGDDPGASSDDGTVLEKDLNLQLATILANNLRDLGYNVALSREDDTNPGSCDDNISSYCSDGRVSNAYSQKAKLVISVHHNSGGASGYEVYSSYYATTTLSSLIANSLSAVSTPSNKEMGYVADGVYKQTFANDQNLSLPQDYMYMIRETGGVATNSLTTENEANNTNIQGAEGLLIEFGYLDDAEDLAHVSDEEIMNEEAKAVTSAVDSYLNRESSLITNTADTD